MRPVQTLEPSTAYDAARVAPLTGGLSESADPSSADLPVHLTHFVGRARELESVARLLERARLLTLTGAGGSGKTRLAAAAAARWAPAEGGRVAWADLTPAGDAGRVATQIADALGVPERPGVGPLDAVRAAVGDQPLLLVLDNCEHVVDAAAAAAEALLRACPGLRVLATSREALGVAGETAWLVPALVAAEARQLFVDRAQAAHAGFALTEANAAAVDEICRRLDGVPLAIELAAARVRALPPDQIAARLDDAFRLLTSGSRTALPRHRTLRATMEWSHALLSARERALLRRLAVFAGGFTLAAAEAVCADAGAAFGKRADAPAAGADPDAGLAAEEVLDGVATLVDKSLVTMGAGDVDVGGEPRYRLLETVRQYARERLAEAGELAAYEAAHAAYFLSVAEAAAPVILGGHSSSDMMARLAAEHDNLRAAAAWTLREAATDPRRGAEALRFADALFWFWYGAGRWLGTGQFTEARRYTAAALQAATQADAALRIRGLLAAGLGAQPQGDYEEARAYFAEGVALARTLRDPGLLAFTLSKLGAAQLMLGDRDAAWASSEEAYALVRELPRSALYGFVGFWRIWTAVERGDLATARFTAESYLRVARESDHRVMIGHSYASLGRVALAEGKADEAHAHYLDGLRTHQEIGDGWGLGLDLEGLSAVAALRGRHADAVRLMGAGDALRDRVAVVLPATDIAPRGARLARARARLGAAAADRAYAEGRALTLEQAAQLAADATVMHTAEYRVPTVPEGHRAAGSATGAVTGASKPAPRLRVLALGPLQVFVGDRAIDAAAWGSARPRELLAYLVAYPEGRTKEQVGLAFWPDASAAQLRNNFHVTLHRLRKALGGPDWVALDGDRYRVPAALVGEFDAASFAREAAEARRTLARPGAGGAEAAAAAQTLERAIARYRGDFLEGEPAGDWHLEFRDHLQRLWGEAVSALGAHHLASGRPGAAAEAYRRLLARDPLREDAAAALMRCHAAMGERAQALCVYRDLAQRLRQELGAAPGAATAALAAELRAA